ncbi:hypothetical protein KO516_05010 [Citreicella sp. C3M06]|uniref:hypothetical protein n=1 Tax=Citreicella sp. C3M06 TaxID=2841564 RepID=UPI001C0A5F4E|nr:hypothetical protein [Citreicella sp. C3M06]MBU2960201.1 hypothetical protein [Citreicella sp. C3M06]
MALIEQIFHEPLSRRISRLLETPFSRRQRRLANRVAELRSLSDDELAARGLAREDILRHVFAGR